MKKFLLFVATLYATASFGSSADAVILSQIYFLSSGAVIVYTNKYPSGDLPACAAGQPYRYAINGASSEGKVQLAGLLTAYVSNKPVNIVGKGTCDAWSDTETISYFNTVN